MEPIISMIQEIKQLQRCRHRRRRSPSPPPESECFSHPRYDSRRHLRPVRTPKKTVRWGSVIKIPPSPPPRYYAPKSRVSRRPVKSILKPATRLDEEMFRHNMWRMVDMANERLDYTYQCIGDMRGMGDEALDHIMKWEERSMRNELTRRVLESAYQLENLSLETTSSHSHRPRMLRRRRTTQF